MKVASGGELARFLLAIKVCLAERGTAPTLVFDEIDTGRRRRGRRRDGSAAGAALGAGAGAGGDPRAAGRRAGAEPLSDRQERRRRGRASRDPRLAPQRAERREEIARMLAGRGNHPRGSRRGREPDREGGMTQ